MLSDSTLYFHFTFFFISFSLRRADECIDIGTSGMTTRVVDATTRRARHSAGMTSLGSGSLLGYL